MNNTNPELPAEVAARITQSAVEYANLLVFYSPDVQAAWEAGATSYAIKWFYSFEENGKLAATVADNLDTIKVLEYDNTRMKGEVEGYKVACEELKQQNEKLTKLKDVLSLIQDQCDDPDKCPDDYFSARLWNIINLCKENK